MVVPRPGADFDPAALVAHLAEVLPSFMIPRYVRTVDALPRSEATLRIQKAVLREHGVDEHTWDRTIVREPR